MRWLILVYLSCIGLAGLTSAQSNRSLQPYGTKGLSKTEEILDELNFPEWYWAGAHVYENVELNYLTMDQELLDQYFGMFPANGVNDPLSLLDDEEQHEIVELVTTHDMKSAIPLYVIVFPYGQDIPLNEAEQREQLLKMFEGKNAFIIFYYYGYARGVKGYVLLNEQGVIKNWEVDELFLKSSRDASLQIGAFAQMKTFVSEFSKRSFWLEQELIPPLPPEKNSSENAVISESKSSVSSKGMQVLIDHQMTLALVFLTMITGGWYYFWSRRWRKYTLVQSNVSVRLGADYGANVSHCVDFSGANISLSKQYEETTNREL